MPEINQDQQQAAKRDTLWMDPDTGDIHCLMWDQRAGVHRIANAEDVWADFIMNREPPEEFCEFDVPEH